jgi:hypothetical protein
MFDALYPEAADTALAARATRIDAPPPVPWFKDAWSATAKAIPRAGAEMGRAMTSLVTPEAAGALESTSVFSAPAQRPKADVAAELREQDQAIRDAIKEMTPDPETTGAASMILHDVTRFVGKAAGYSALGGVTGAVAGMTLDEGGNEYLRRLDEGIDPATAAKLGVVKGVSSGVAVALPVAGKTIAGTVGLAVAGGPVGYVAEQATARSVLAEAGYQDEADRIDPFDPLGLGVAFFGSLLFGAGAHGARGLKARAEAKMADERMLAADRPPGEQTPVAQAARQFTREQADAAHVAELQAHREAHALHRPEEIRAAAVHALALDRAAEQIATGQRVSVGDVLADTFPDTPTARAVLDEIDTLQAERAELLPAVAERAEPGEVARMREELRALQETRPADGPAAERELAKEIQATERVSYKAALAEAKKQITDRLADFEGRVQRLEQAIERNAQAARAEERLAAVDQRLSDLDRQAPEVRLSRFQRAMTDAVTELEKAAPKQPRAAAPAPKAETAPGQQPAAPAKSAPAKEKSAAAPRQQQDASSTPPLTPEAAAHLEAETARIEAENPDMPVMLEGMDAPRPMREVLAEVLALAKQEVADAPLVKVAAECALRG